MTVKLYAELQILKKKAELSWPKLFAELSELSWRKISAELSELS